VISLHNVAVAKEQEHLNVQLKLASHVTEQDKSKTLSAKDAKGPVNICQRSVNNVRGVMGQGNVGQSATDVQEVVISKLLAVSAKALAGLNSNSGAY
jgi:hypothetical protein